MSDRPPDVAIVGAGLTGCLLACYLARRGLRITVYERRPDPRIGEVEAGRSINLAISERGLDALRRIGLDGEVMAEALPMRGRMIHDVDGALDFQPYSASGDLAINSISRAALNEALLDAADASPDVDMVFDHRLALLDPSSGSMTFETDGGPIGATAPVVIGADGAGSAVRRALLDAGLLSERSEFLGHGYKELHIPARDGEFALDPGALHIWPRGGSMMIALPNPDRTFTCTLFWPSSGEGSFGALDDPAAIERHFERHYPDVVGLAPTLVDDYRRNPVSPLGTVHATPWQTHGRVGLIGDAAHAIVPFYGQGANCAFEDVVELDRCLDESGGDWSVALPRYELRRHEHTEAIATMALENFVEMRDKVASPVWRFGKRIEHAIERTLPGVYRSRYEMVSFTTIPYADVRRRARLQHAALAAAAFASVAVVSSAFGRMSSRRRTA